MVNTDGTDVDERSAESQGLVVPAVPPASTSRLAIKDVVTLSISMLALAVSAASFYVTNFRVEEKALVRIADTTIEPGTEDDQKNGYRNGFVIMQLAFVNGGNRPVVILGADYQLSERPDLSAGGFGGQVETAEPAFPLLMPPRDVRVLNVRIPLKVVIGSFDNGAAIAERSGTGEPLRRFFGGLHFHTLDTQERVHDTWTGMQIQIDVTRTAWHGLAPVDRRRKYVITQLLEPLIK